MNMTPANQASTPSDARCLICGAANLAVHYRGPVRCGAFGKTMAKEAEITRCGNCGAQYLPPAMEDIAHYYQSGDYRKELEQGNAVEKYFQLSDNEQPGKVELLGLHQLRGKVVADLGCGGGSFLDLVKGVAAQTIAIEPDQNYHPSLAARGHRIFSLGSDALAQCRAALDVIVSFSVIEHVEKPREFLTEARQLLKPGGRMLLSTPNARDLLLELSPEYRAFFYRKAHLWYFDADALVQVAKLAGFEKCQIIYKHRFDLSNCLVWLRDRRPSGLGAIALDPSVNAVWAQSLETQGRSDYLYAILS